MICGRFEMSRVGSKMQNSPEASTHYFCTWQHDTFSETQSGVKTTRIHTVLRRKNHFIFVILIELRMSAFAGICSQVADCPVLFCCTKRLGNHTSNIMFCNFACCKSKMPSLHGFLKSHPWGLHEKGLHPVASAAAQL